MALSGDARALQLQYQELEQSAQKTMRELSALLQEVSGPQAGTGEQSFQQQHSPGGRSPRGGLPHQEFAARSLVDTWGRANAQQGGGNGGQSWGTASGKRKGPRSQSPGRRKKSPTRERGDGQLPGNHIPGNYHGMMPPDGEGPSTVLGALLNQPLATIMEASLSGTFGRSLLSSEGLSPGSTIRQLLETGSSASPTNGRPRSLLTADQVWETDLAFLQQQLHRGAAGGAGASSTGPSTGPQSRSSNSNERSVSFSSGDDHSGSSSARAAGDAQGQQESSSTSFQQMPPQHLVQSAVQSLAAQRQGGGPDPPAFNFLPPELIQSPVRVHGPDSSARGARRGEEDAGGDPTRESSTPSPDSPKTPRSDEGSANSDLWSRMASKVVDRQKEARGYLFRQWQFLVFPPSQEEELLLTRNPPTPLLEEARASSRMLLQRSFLSWKNLYRDAQQLVNVVEQWYHGHQKPPDLGKYFQAWKDSFLEEKIESTRATVEKQSAKLESTDRLLQFLHVKLEELEKAEGAKSGEEGEAKPVESEMKKTLESFLRATGGAAGGSGASSGGHDKGGARGLFDNIPGLGKVDLDFRKGFDGEALKVLAEEIAKAIKGVDQYGSLAGGGPGSLPFGGPGSLFGSVAPPGMPPPLGSGIPHDLAVSDPDAYRQLLREQQQFMAQRGIAASLTPLAALNLNPPTNAGGNHAALWQDPSAAPLHTGGYHGGHAPSLFDMSPGRKLGELPPVNVPKLPGFGVNPFSLPERVGL